jgi:hypothetical protein
MILLVGAIQGIALWLGLNLALISCVFTSALIVASGWNGIGSPKWVNDLLVVGGLFLAGLIAACATWILCQTMGLVGMVTEVCSERSFYWMWRAQEYGLLLVGLVYWVFYRGWIFVQFRRLR